MSRVTWSGRGYRGMEEVENNPLVSISWESKEELAKFSLRSAVQLITERFPLISPPSMPPPASPASNPSTPTSTPPPPPPKVRIVSAVQLPIFKGVGNEEPDPFWFVIKSIWDA